jgi:capsular polysaccharide biosynthesis protein
MNIQKLSFKKNQTFHVYERPMPFIVFFNRFPENIKKTKFYNSYLKTLRYIIFFKFVIKFFYILFNYLNNKINFLLGQKSKAFHLIKMKYFIKNKSIKKFRLIEPTVVKIISPHFIPSKNIFPGKNNYPDMHFPEIYVATIQEAIVIGGSHLSIVNNEIISHDLLTISTDLTPEERHLRINRKGNICRLTYKIMTKKFGKLSEAASFVDALSSNYAHWMTEVLPRIVSFCSNSQYSHVPIVVDDKLHQNIMATLEKVVGRRRVYLLPMNHVVKIDMLYATSVAGYISYEQRYKYIQASSEGKFNAQAMRLVVSLLKPLNGKKQTPERIYLRRNSAYRNLTNQNEIEALLTSHRFTIVDPAKLSFLEQVNYFSKVKVIIGPTGASFANLIFCNKKVNLAILVNNDKKQLFYVFFLYFRSIFL